MNVISLALRRVDALLDRDDGNVITLEPAELAPPPLSVLERSHNATATALSILRGNQVRLRAEIDQRTETLRQTDIAIEAYEKAEAIIEAGKLPLAAE